MDYVQLLNEVKMRSDDEVKMHCKRQYGIDLSNFRNKSTTPITG